MITYRGTIAAISGHPMSGLWSLHFEDGTSCHIESGHGVRQLAACFGAREGSGDLQEKIEGQDIIYSVDSFNVMCGFTPTSQWEGPPIPPEGIEEDEMEELFVSDDIYDAYEDGYEQGKESARKEQE